MKKIGLILLGTGAAMTIGGIVYHLYREYQREKASMNLEEPPQKADIAEVMTQCLIEAMEPILKLQHLASQIKTTERPDVSNLKKGIRAKCNI